MRAILDNNNKFFNVSGSMLAVPSPSEWANSFSMTITSSCVSADRADFPVLIHLGTNSGITSVDKTNVFTEVSANSARIAIKDSDGIELPIEIESWDVGGQEAYLWTKVPQVSASQNTELTFYYDNTHVNQTNVYESGTPGASAVWNSDFAGVWHNPETGTITRKDSTSNNYSGKPWNGITKANRINGADDYDGINDYTSFPTSATDLYGGSEGTISIWCYPRVQVNPLYGAVYSTRDHTNSKGFSLFLYRGSPNAIQVGSRQGGGGVSTGSNVYSPNTKWYHIVYTHKVGSQKIYVDGVEEGTSTNTQNWLQGVQPPVIGREIINFTPFRVYDLNGEVDEVRVYTKTISPEEVGIEYCSQNDQLIVYGT